VKEVHFQESKVYFRRAKEGKTKKNLGKDEGYGGNEKREKFYFEN